MSTPCSQHDSGLSPQLLKYGDGQRFSHYQDFLRAPETKFDDEVLRKGYSNDTEALRAELYRTKLKLLATQLAYENLALSVGSPNSRLAQMDSTFRLYVLILICFGDDVYARDPHL